MGHGLPGEPGADPAHTETCGFDKWQAAENEMYRRAERYPALLEALRQQHQALVPNKQLPHNLCAICDIIEEVS